MGEWTRRRVGRDREFTWVVDSGVMRRGKSLMGSLEEDSVIAILQTLVDSLEDGSVVKMVLKAGESCV